MPKLELGDLEGIRALEGREHPASWRRLVDAGYDLVAPIPSCVLDVQAGAAAHVSRDDADVEARRRTQCSIPFEYLVLRHRAARLRTGFHAAAGQGRLSRRLSPARAEHRPEDARAARARARHDGQIDRALRRSRLDLYGVRRSSTRSPMRIGDPVVDSVSTRSSATAARATARWPDTISARDCKRNARRRIHCACCAAYGLDGSAAEQGRWPAAQPI